MCLRQKRHMYMVALRLFTELKVLPSNVIRIKCNDFEEPINASDHWSS
jgi:hypothetical protein